MIHRTRPEDALQRGDWIALRSGARISAWPLYDGAHPDLFARLSYRDAKAACARLGARLPTLAELRELAETLPTIEPVALPIANDLATSQEHDRLARWRAGPRGRNVFGLGKHWTSGAPEGRAYLAGWPTWMLEKYTPNRRGMGWVQEGTESGPGPHDDSQFDYATTTLIVCDAGLLDSIADLCAGAIRAVKARSFALMHLERALREVGIAEILGPRSEARVLEYLAICERDGKPLGLASDEYAWCAAFASWCGLPEGMRPRASVAELVAGARRAGALVTGDAMSALLPGDLLIYERGGQSPLRGGKGHVNRIVSCEPLSWRCVGGNEGARGAVEISIRDRTSAVAGIRYA